MPFFIQMLAEVMQLMIVGLPIIALVIIFWAVSNRGRNRRTTNLQSDMHQLQTDINQIKKDIADLRDMVADITIRLHDLAL